MDLRLLIERALGAELAPPRAAGVAIREVCDDSRRVVHGALFVAVTGTQACGAVYAGEAAYRGAAAIVAETDVAIEKAWTPEPPEGYGGPVVVKVPDARHALARLAATSFGLDRIQDDGELAVTGVTGTNGKTTVAYMLRSILRAAGRRVAMLGTIEYDLVGRRMPADLTTPGPIALTRYLVEAHAAGGRYAVMEASSHSLDQRRTEGIRFSTAIFTNLTQDHLDYHRTAEEYLRSKRRLFDGLGREAVAVVNADEPASERMVENCEARVMTYGMTGRADVRGREVQALGSGAGKAVGLALEYRGERVEVHPRLVGRHNALNALAAAAGGLAMGLDMGSIERGLAGLSHVPGRLQLVDAGDLGFEVYVDYAHTEDALRNVLRAVRPLAQGRLWCVFGCGGDRDRTKRPLMARAVAEGTDGFIITSDNPRTEDPLAIIGGIERGLSAEDRGRALTVPDRAVAIRQAINRLSPGDLLVIAGKGHEDYQILGSEKVHFDDVEVARSAIARRQAGVECRL